ncbi:nudix hydrolase [Bacillus phage SP-15]|uniref:Nudix hydrolase n=1 Tax=Bacillus phage SP-15 TaxID=1792032 RepID=A0A127AYS1_9CAUD|nr:nudix hydrolase [Bacillus phage SP-15]AMM44891.1 nudix hydrolase [Bacillus phage SP-15]
MNPKWDEVIIVAPRLEVFEDEKLTFEGVITDQAKVSKIVGNISKYYTTIRRGHPDDSTPKENNAEINFDYKQPIPYAVIRRANQVFLYRRLAGGGESRLQDKLSLGVGGHMNQIGLPTFEQELSENLNRELNEEVDLKAAEVQIVPYGLINDESDDVNKVHIGILYGIEVDSDATVEVKETDQLQGEWVDINELHSSSDFNRLENWSQIAIEYLVNLKK